MYHSLSHAWSLEYEKKGRLWGNAPSITPPGLPDSTSASDLVYLDLGAGDGKCFRGILGIHSCITLLAVDFSIAALRLCPQHIQRICADAITLPFRDQVIDHIYAHHVLGHIPVESRTEAVAEMVRIAKPGAMIWVVVFERSDFRAGKGNVCTEEYTYLRGNGIMTHYFTEEELVQLFSCCTLMYTKIHRWDMQIRGVSYSRAMIEGLFQCSVF